MIEYSREETDALFHALADGTRRSILERIAERDLTVTEIAEPYDISLAAVSKHLQVLERANLIVRRRDDQDRRTHWCSLNRIPLDHAVGLIEVYRQKWERQLDNLERYLATRKPSAPDAQP